MLWHWMKSIYSVDDVIEDISLDILMLLKTCALRVSDFNVLQTGNSFINHTNEQGQMFRENKLSYDSARRIFNFKQIARDCSWLITNITQIAKDYSRSITNITQIARDCSRLIINIAQILRIILE